MNSENQKEQISIKNKYTVHHVLAYSYSSYFILFLIGVYLDFVYKFSLFTDSAMMPLGFIFLILASVLIVWAQKTGRDLRKVEEVKVEHFCRGPYCYTRIPTQWGLLFLMLGFALVTNSFFVLLATIVAFILSRFVFIGEHEKILTEKYGNAYLEYKKLVKF